MAVVSLCNGSLAVFPIDSQLLVREYEYRMDGFRTGSIFLLDGPENRRQVSFWSAKTNMHTPWHGLWFSPTGNLDDTFNGNFDYKGRNPLGLRKYFAVRREGPRVDKFVGEDYMDRLILIDHVATHTYENTGLRGGRTR